MKKLLAVLMAGISLAMQPALAEDKLEFSSEDPILVKADEAWEESDGEVTHFRGNFEMSGASWSVFADEASVYGKLDDPERIVITGAPARAWINKADEAGRVEGEGERIEYLRSTDSLSLSGNAIITDGESTVRSGLIEYDLIEKRFKASGDQGVTIVVDRNKEKEEPQ